MSEASITLLRCHLHGRKKPTIAALRGAWRITRPLTEHENASDGRSAVWCRKCGQKYEAEQQAAAA